MEPAELEGLVLGGGLAHRACRDGGAGVGWWACTQSFQRAHLSPRQETSEGGEGSQWDCAGMAGDVGKHGSGSGSAMCVDCHAESQ